MLKLTDFPEIIKLFASGVGIGALSGAILFFLSFLIGFFYKLMKKL